MSTATAIDLSAWCEHDTEGSRFAMGQPFVFDGWRYATDGRRAIRVPAPGEPNTVAEGRIPRANTAFEGFPETLDELPEAPLTTRGVRDCPACDGDGHATREPCGQCKGKAECRCGCGDEHDCHVCRGTGTIGYGRCGTCKGEKRFEQPNLVELGGTTIDARFFEVVKALPGPIRFAVVGEGLGRLVAFAFDGGQAVVAMKKRDC